MFGKIFKIIINGILFILVIIGIFVVFSFIPFPGNYKVFTVESGSMEPAIKTGSLIFVKAKNDYNVGEIITRKTNDPNVTVTHRIATKEKIDYEVYYQTKGDANNVSDSEKVTPDSVIGKMIWGLPFLGYPVDYARTTQGLILIIIIPAIIIIYDEMNKIKGEVRMMMDNRKKDKKEKSL